MREATQRSLRSRNRWKNHFPRAIRRAGRLGVSLMKRTLRKKGIVNVLRSTDGVRFALRVSEGSSGLCQRWHATRGKGWSLRLRGEKAEQGSSLC